MRFLRGTIVIWEETGYETASMTCVRQVLLAELGNHRPLFNSNDQMPEKMKGHNPEKTDPVIEEDCKPWSANGNKRCVQRMTNPAIGTLRT